jgi:uncharacterized cupredoxin-like copper-binding protein
VLVIGGVVALAQLGDGGTRDAMPGMDMGETSAMDGMEMGTPTTPSTARRDPETIELVLDDYAITPLRLTVVPGAYRISARNVDGVQHDVTLIRTDLAADSLPTVDVRVDETPLDVRARTSVIAAGQAGDLVASLESGRYVLVCTVPHHYVRERMIAEVQVSG